MPDREKVIKGIHQHCEGSMFDRCGECPYYEFAHEPFVCRDMLLNDLSELLKEQEAVEPSTYHYLFICPVCKTTLKREQKFCHECGKRIEWKGR